MPSPRVFFCILSLCFFWLTAWIVLSWGAVQDDAMIHLRYAQNLAQHASITYDGVHPNYGTSSLLYVCILALLERVGVHSSDLPRAVSSGVHLLLFLGMAFGIGQYLPGKARLARLTALLLLMLLAVPSAVRWLDDGMETGLVLSIATAFAWLLRVQADRIDSGSDLGWPVNVLGLASFVAVLLRPELLLLCAGGLLILMPEPTESGRRFRIAMPILVGALLGLATIFGTMHVLLPDTAVAKSLGIRHWWNPIHDTATTLGGALTFGAGLLLFWLLTLALVAMHGKAVGTRTWIANCFFPVLLGLSAIRGQEIQGVRYFAWTFFFSATWNMLHLAKEREGGWCESRREMILLSAFATFLVAVLPFESVAMHRVLMRRRETIHTFEAQHLEVLRQSRGLASDIGYIGYFSQGSICDLAGLVNGRVSARMSPQERADLCAATDPDFVFLNSSQLGRVASIMNLSQWQICGRYDFENVTTRDTHYLIVRPSLADEVCGATGLTATPIVTILPNNALLH